MRASLLAPALTAIALAALAAAPSQARASNPSHHHRHVAHLHRYAHVAHGYHIPRFDQGEAEAYVHTVYPYRTGLYVPWPDAYATPYPYGPYGY